MMEATLIGILFYSRFSHWLSLWEFIFPSDTQAQTGFCDIVFGPGGSRPRPFDHPSGPMMPGLFRFVALNLRSILRVPRSHG